MHMGGTGVDLGIYKAPGDELKKLKRGFNFEQTWTFVVQKMKTIVAVNLLISESPLSRNWRIFCRHDCPTLLIALLSLATLFTVAIAGHVTGSKLEATEGQNVTIHFETGLERVNEVKIIFEGGSKGKLLRAKYCSPDAVSICEPIYDQLLHVEEGNVSFVLVNVTISQSGRYTAEVITADNHVFEVTATLEVNQAPVSSTTSPPHSSSSPKPPRSADLPWLYALIPVIIIIIIIIILCFCFWKHGMIPCFKREKESETSSSDRVSVNMNGCGENTEALLTDTRVS